MGPQAIKTSAESPFLKWGQFLVSVILVPVLLRANDSLEDVKKNQQTLATHVAVLDEQMAALRVAVPQNSAQFAEINSSLVDLKDKVILDEFRVTNLEAWQKLMSRRAP